LKNQSIFLYNKQQKNISINQPASRKLKLPYGMINTGGEFNEN